MSAAASARSCENLPPRTLARLAREVRDLYTNPPEGLRLVVDNDSGLPGNLGELTCELAGPQGTPYESKFFLLKLVFPLDFPASPPRGFFLTKIYHPNVEMSGGAICVNTLKKDWTSAVTLSHVLAVIRCLLIVPFPESSLNDEAGKLFMNSYQEYYNRAKLMADVHGRSESICSRANNNNREQDNDDEQPVKKIMATDDRVLKNSSSSSSNNTNNNNSQQLPLSTTSAAPQFLQTKELPQKKLDKKKGLKRL